MSRNIGHILNQSKILRSACTDAAADSMEDGVPDYVSPPVLDGDHHDLLTGGQIM